MSQFCFIDDSVAGVGGTALTLDAIVEPERGNVDFVPTSDLQLSDLFKDYELFILGNTLGFDKNSFDCLIHLTETLRFVKIEFDYGYCMYRGKVPHKILAKEECSCPFGATGTSSLCQLYDNIKTNALHIFYMSEGQMKMHDDSLMGVNKKKKSVLEGDSTVYRPLSSMLCA